MNATINDPLAASNVRQYTSEMFEQLAQIDRAHSKEEMDQVIYLLLRLIGKGMRADRVFLFDSIDRERETYSNTFEWCEDGVEPQIDNLAELVRADMPCWLERFERGETIFIPNLEAVRTQMPSEYEILKAQSIRSVIAVPVFYRSNLSGFFGLDNPKAEITDAQVHLLNFIGGHLGSARENLRMLTLLEEKQKSLEQNLQAVQLEQRMLKVVCRDSTSVYRVDLMSNTAEIVKLEEHANAAGTLPREQAFFVYSDEIRRYYDSFIVKGTAPDFLQLLDAKNLMRELEKKDSVSRRYQSVPNAIGQIFFEVRVNKLQRTETSFQVLMDFRSVDEIVKEEREHQHALETALTESRMSYEVISAISKIYLYDLPYRSAHGIL
mgnify:CR=1 FL=1